MAHFVMLGCYSQPAIAGIVKKPGDRSGTARAVAESVGGKLLSFHITRGAYDWVATVDAPDAERAMAVKLALVASGAISKIDILEAVDVARIADAAGKALAAYKPPG